MMLHLCVHPPGGLAGVLTPVLRSLLPMIFWCWVSFARAFLLGGGTREARYSHSHASARSPRGFDTCLTS